MAFIDMPGSGFQSQQAKRAHAADTQYDFLLDAGIDVTAIELIGDSAVGFLIFRQVAVEQVQPDMAGACLPDLQLVHHDPGNSTLTCSSQPSSLQAGCSGSWSKLVVL